MIDIIIPVHNAGETIGNTLKSLEIQTNKDFNVMLVVDGVSEEEYGTYPLVTNFDVDIQVDGYMDNRGAGEARNYGLKRTSSEWVMFLDADDLLLPYAISSLQGFIEKKPDFIIGQTIRESENGYFESVGKEQVTWIHGRLYNRDFLYRNGIKFPNLRMSEDLAFNSICAEMAGTVYDTGFPIHMQRYRKGSLSHSENSIRLQAETYIPSCYFYSTSCMYYKPPKDLKLLPQFIAMSYFYIDAERERDAGLYKTMKLQFKELCKLVDFDELYSNDDFRNALNYYLTQQIRPYTYRIEPPKKTFEQMMEEIL